MQASRLPLRFLILACTGWVACAAQCGCGSSDSGIPLGEKQSGIATYYAATGGGACSFDPGGDLLVAALNAEQYDWAASCGACAEVKGPNGTVTVRIVDKCPECQSGHLDLSREAFEKIAPLEKGRVDIEWQLVSCDVDGPLRYRFKEGSSQYWTAIQVRNHRVPVQSLEWQDSGKWVSLKREDYNYFVASEGVGSGALSLRVTAQGGQQLTDTLPGVREAEELSGAAQFDAR